MVTPTGRRATLKDVAELAGTSVATASRVLSGAGPVADLKRQRILQAAAMLNYQPNLQARALRHGNSRSIGLILPNLRNAYYTALADAISQILDARGYHLTLSPTRDDPRIEAETLREMVGQNVSGVTMVPCATDPAAINYLYEQDVPAVALVRSLPGAAVDTVTFEDCNGAAAATRYLLSLGHREIGYIGGDVNFTSNHARWQGFLSAMQGAGCPPRDELVKLGRLESTWGAVAALDLLRLASPPTAIFVGSNILMQGVFQALQAQNVVAPRDVSLVCFDDVEWFSLTVPTITAVSHSHSRLADAALMLLFNRIERADQRHRPPVSMEIGFELMVRNSTGAPRRHELALGATGAK